MTYSHKPPRSLCNENPADCHFELKTFPAGTMVYNDNVNSNYLIFCQSGHARIMSTLFHNEILCTGEVMFVPRMSECSGIALSNVTLLVHKFNNTVCRTEKCILSYLYSHRQIESKIYCCKLIVCPPLQTLMKGIISYLCHGVNDFTLWKMKHKELIWIFTRHYPAAELCSFFHPIIDEQIPFRSLVMTNYRKANNTEEFADLCGYGIHTFRRHFKKHFGMPVYKWLTQKRAERVKYMLLLPYIPFADIIDEFDFSTSSSFCSFCKTHLGDSPTNIRKSVMKDRPINTDSNF